jgi:hypothetical protein
MEAMVTVEADSEDKAEEKAMALPDDEKYWELEQVDKDTEEVCGIYQKEDRKKKVTAEGAAPPEGQP